MSEGRVRKMRQGREVGGRGFVLDGHGGQSGGGCGFGGEGGRELFKGKAAFPSGHSLRRVKRQAWERQGESSSVKELPTGAGCGNCFGEEGVRRIGGVVCRRRRWAAS